MAKWNTRITITRTVTTNPRLEPKNGANTPAATNVYALLTQTNTSSTNDSGAHPRVVRFATLRTLSSVDIRKNDRITDQITGIIWIVDEITNWDRNSPINPGLSAKLRSI